MPHAPKGDWNGGRFNQAFIQGQFVDVDYQGNDDQRLDEQKKLLRDFGLLDEETVKAKADLLQRFKEAV